MQASGSTARRSTAGQSLERSYRLIDGSCEPHLQLDGQYSSLDDAIADAIEWIGLSRGPRNLRYLPASDCHKKRPFGIVAANQKCASNVI